MNASMIKIELNAQMEAAIKRCKKTHPKVRRVDAETVAVSGHKETYLVKILKPKADLVLAECTCQGFGGRKGNICYHIPAALAAPTAPVKHPLAGMLVKHMDGAVRIDGWMV